MDETLKLPSKKRWTGLTACILIALALILISVVLGWFDTTTELTPAHDGVLQSCFIISGLAGLIWGGISIPESRGMALWRRVVTACCVVVLASVAVFLLSSNVADLIEGRLDFPSAKITTYPEFVMISRAYQTHGKSQSWNIQTTPIWSNLDVTQADYQFMLAHRSPNDPGTNPDEISSHGFFCARVTLQQSGMALRILHAGSGTLPFGSVVICPPAPSQPPILGE